MGSEDACFMVMPHPASRDVKENYGTQCRGPAASVLVDRWETSPRDDNPVKGVIGGTGADSACGEPFFLAPRMLNKAFFRF